MIAASRSTVLTGGARLPVCLTGLVLALLLGAAQAQPSQPYTPGVAARHALALLVDEADLPLTLTQWPLPARAVALALEALPAAGLTPALQQARDTVQADLRRASSARVDLRLRPRADTLVGFGDDYAPASSLTVVGSDLAGPSVAESSSDAMVSARFGLRVEGDAGALPGRGRGGARVRLDESAVATEALGVQLQAWTRRNWWGPGWRSSLILGNNAPPLTGVSLQRAAGGVSTSPWLSWLGPWNLEAFVAQHEGDAAPAYAWLVGQRLSARPWPGIELGLSRTAQWGGRGRDQSARSFMHMLVGSGTNADTKDQQASDPGNQVAGFDLRARCPAGWPCAGYLQLIGEDMAGYTPSRYLSLYGVEAWSADGRRRYTLEYSDTACGSTPDAQRAVGCAYRNFQYPNGYASAGRWLGASQGPDARLLSFGLFDQAGTTRLRLDLGQLSGFDGAAPTLVWPGTAVTTRLLAVQAQQSYAWAGGLLTPELGWQRLSRPGRTRSDVTVGASWSVTLDSGALGDPARAAGWAPAGTRSGLQGEAGWFERHPVQAGALLLTGAVLLDRTADRYAQSHGDNPSTRTWRRAGDALPTLALGVAGTQWLFQRGSPAGDTALAAAAAGTAAYASSRLLKTAIARDRPVEGFGPNSFGHSSKTPRGDSSLPSNHAAIAWAVLTPYAQAYGQDWLYGLAALTGAGRVLGREHWTSDVVLGSLLGYHLGRSAPGWTAGQGQLSWTGQGLIWQTALP